MKRTAILLGTLLLVAGCNKPSRARVECRAVGNNVNCSVIHEQGTHPVNVCWDVAFSCADGANVTGHACQDVDPQGRAEHMITADQLQGLAQCNGATSFVVRNMAVTDH